MAKVVRESGRLGDNGIEPNIRASHFVTVLNAESLRRPTSDLGHLESMREAIMEDVSLEGPDYLGDSGRSSQCRRVEHAVAILLTGGTSVLGFLHPTCSRVSPGVRRCWHSRRRIRRARSHDCRQ
jgi:hypothetical protein